LLARSLLMTWHDALRRTWFRLRHPDAATPCPVRAGGAGARLVRRRPGLRRHGGVRGGTGQAPCPAFAGQVIASRQNRNSGAARATFRQPARAGYPGRPLASRCRRGSATRGTAGAAGQGRRGRPGRSCEGGQGGRRCAGRTAGWLAGFAPGSCGCPASAGRHGPGVPGPRRILGRSRRAGRDRASGWREPQRPSIGRHWRSGHPGQDQSRGHRRHRAIPGRSGFPRRRSAARGCAPRQRRTCNGPGAAQWQGRHSRLCAERAAIAQPGPATPKRLQPGCERLGAGETGGPASRPVRRCGLRGGQPCRPHSCCRIPRRCRSGAAGRATGGAGQGHRGRRAGRRGCSGTTWRHIPNRTRHCTGQS